MSKATTGPWVFNGGDSAPIIHLYGPDGKGLFHNDRPLEEQEANARIMAAAYEMAGALQFILAFYEPGQRHLDTEAWKHAEAAGRAALAKSGYGK